MIPLQFRKKERKLIKKDPDIIDFKLPTLI